MLYIGVDLGTSAVKLLLMKEDGTIENIVSKEYPLFFPHPGWSEQKPEDWLTAVKEGIKELTANCDKTQVAGIGAGGQMHGLVALDADDMVLRPAILWNDGRCQEETDYLNNEIGKEKLTEYTGNIAFAGFTAPKILWMRNHEPELFARIARVMLPKDYINYMLSGVNCTDYSDASGMLLLDVKNKCWSKPMLESCCHWYGNRRKRSLQHFAGNLRYNFHLLRYLWCRQRKCTSRICTRRRRLPSDGLHAFCCILQQVVYG